jgi:hypothetical protein
MESFKSVLVFYPGLKYVWDLCLRLACYSNCSRGIFLSGRPIDKVAILKFSFEGRSVGEDMAGRCFAHFGEPENSNCLFKCLEERNISCFYKLKEPLGLFLLS